MVDNAGSRIIFLGENTIMKYTVMMVSYDYTKRKPKQLNKTYRNIKADDIKSACCTALEKWNKHAEISMVWANYPQ